MKPCANAPASPLGLVTTTLTAPAECVGVVAVIRVSLATTTLVAAMPPKLTVAPLVNLVPVIVTLVPPLIEPEPGLTLLTVGALAFTLNLSLAMKASCDPL